MVEGGERRRAAELTCQCLKATSLGLLAPCSVACQASLRVLLHPRPHPESADKKRPAGEGNNTCGHCTGITCSYIGFLHVQHSSGCFLPNTSVATIAATVPHAKFVLVLGGQVEEGIAVAKHGVHQLLGHAVVVYLEKANVVRHLVSAQRCDVRDVMCVGKVCQPKNQRTCLS